MGVFNQEYAAKMMLVGRYFNDISSENQRGRIENGNYALSKACPHCGAENSVIGNGRRLRWCIGSRSAKIAVRRGKCERCHKSPHRTSRAQRLTASEGWISWRGGCVALRPLCAQRLTASEGWIRRDPPGRSKKWQSVLNALRHQRVGSDETRVKAFLAAKCSTPYGIRGLDQCLLLG